MSPPIHDPVTCPACAGIPVGCDVCADEGEVERWEAEEWRRAEAEEDEEDNAPAVREHLAVEPVTDPWVPVDLMAEHAAEDLARGCYGWRIERRCGACDGTGTVLDDLGQAGDQTIQEEIPCPECGGGSPPQTALNAPGAPIPPEAPSGAGREGIGRQGAVPTRKEGKP